MKCTDFENRLNDLLDDRLSPQEDAALLGHAENCLDCREMLAAQESLFRGMALLQRRTPSPDLAARVLSELNAPAAPITLPPPVRTPFRWVRVFASAAAVLVAVSLGIWIVSRNNQQPTVAQPGPKNHSGLAIVKPGGSRPQKPAPQPESVAVKPQPTPQSVPAPVPSALQPDIDEAMASLASHWHSSAQWQVETIDVEHYAPGIRPIRESFEVAIDALLKTIPHGKKEMRPAPPQALQYGGPLDLA